MIVPFLNLKAQYHSLKPAIDAAMSKAVENGEFIGGPELKKFEAAFAKAHGVKHCIGVGNGTDALFVILKSIGLAPGDHVITVANSFIATSEATTLAGGKTLFVDCDPAHYTIDLVQLERTLERATRDGLRVKAIMPVHLFGRACDMTAIMKLATAYGCAVIEDCAQAHLARHAGKPVGSFGIAAGFSFYPGKNLGAYGDAGCILTNDDALALKMRMFANHGRVEKYDHVVEGINSRLDGIQAAVLNVKLEALKGWTEQRIAHARRYLYALAGVKGLTLPTFADDFGHVFHLFVVRLQDRERVRAALKEQGIDTGVHYPAALPNLAAYKYLGHARGDFPNSSSFESQVMSLPMFAELTNEQIDHVAACLTKALS